jgi:hypothetical protein
MNKFWDTEVMEYFSAATTAPGSVWKPMLATGAGLSDILGLTHDEFLDALGEIEPRHSTGALPLDMKAEYDK